MGVALMTPAQYYDAVPCSAEHRAVNAQRPTLDAQHHAGRPMKPELDPAKPRHEPSLAIAQDFAEFLKTREQASAAYVRGNVAPLAAITSRTDPASFMPPSGSS